MCTHTVLAMVININTSQQNHTHYWSKHRSARIPTTALTNMQLPVSVYPHVGTVWRGVHVDTSCLPNPHTTHTHEINSPECFKMANLRLVQSSDLWQPSVDTHKVSYSVLDSKGLFTSRTPFYKPMTKFTCTSCWVLTTTCLGIPLSVTPPIHYMLGFPLHARGFPSVSRLSFCHHG